MTILDPPASLVPLPPQPAGVPWPTVEWPTGPLPDHVDADALAALLDRAFGPTPDPGFGESHALVVVQGGRIVAERYGPGLDATSTLLSWSMAKSILHALVGILVDHGRLELHAPAPVPEWAGDDRSRITLHQLLRMVDGLDFNETYALPDDPDADVPVSHCIEMLFGEGGADHAGYAAARPAAHPPGTVFNYSSGTSNIVARIVCDVIGRGDDAATWMRANLFDPIGMRSATPKVDDAGNFVGSSFVYATARDFARFGLLYLRGGEWAGRQLLPREWVDDARTTRAVDDEGRSYGSHWWTYEDGRGGFYASGYEFQRIICIPATDLVVVRLGKTAEADYDTPRTWLAELVGRFDTEEETEPPEELNPVAAPGGATRTSPTDHESPPHPG